MIKNERLLAVIPARGGSKRLPRKNLLNLDGKPMIAWTIEAALTCEYIDRVVVSTDDDEIAQISEQHGADIPIMRPEILASDDAKSVDAVLHMLKALAEHGDSYQYVVLLQPTSPFRNSLHINKAVRQLVNLNGTAVISVCKAEHHPLWCNTIDEDLSLNNFLRKDIINLQTQDLPVYYRLNGAIYLITTHQLKTGLSFFPQNDSSAFIMDEIDSVDIDTELDYLLVQQIINNKRAQ